MNTTKQRMVLYTRHSDACWSCVKRQVINQCFLISNTNCFITFIIAVCILFLNRKVQRIRVWTILVQLYRVNISFYSIPIQFLGRTLFTDLVSRSRRELYNERMEVVKCTLCRFEEGVHGVCKAVVGNLKLALWFRSSRLRGSLAKENDHDLWSKGRDPGEDCHTKIITWVQVMGSCWDACRNFFKEHLRGAKILLDQWAWLEISF